VGVLDVNAIEAQQRKTDRKGARRPSAGGLEEIFTRARGRPARTFPVSFPLLRLDRIYVKNATLRGA
jgi:endonuclease/exonuclease/phosphatase family metal-dependent hydrolase